MIDGQIMKMGELAVGMSVKPFGLGVIRIKGQTKNETLIATNPYDIAAYDPRVPVKWDSGKAFFHIQDFNKKSLDQLDEPKEESEESKEYKAGYDAGLNMPNTRNCNFSLFSTPEKTKNWEKGNNDGCAAKGITS